MSAVSVRVLTVAAATSALNLCVHAANAAEDFTQHEAHVHGEVELSIAIEGSSLSIELDAPAVNVAGFEHAARSTQERAKLRAAEQSLKSWQNLFLLPDAASCRFARQSITPPQWQSEHEPGDAHGEQTHAAYLAHWEFTCANPAALTFIESRVVAHLTDVRKLTVNVATSTGQRQHVLEGGDVRVPLQ